MVCIDPFGTTLSYRYRLSTQQRAGFHRITTRCRYKWSSQFGWNESGWRVLPFISTLRSIDSRSQFAHWKSKTFTTLRLWVWYAKVFAWFWFRWSQWFWSSTFLHNGSMCDEKSPGVKLSTIWYNSRWNRKWGKSMHWICNWWRSSTRISITWCAVLLQWREAKTIASGFLIIYRGKRKPSSFLCGLLKRDWLIYYQLPLFHKFCIWTILASSRYCYVMLMTQIFIDADMLWNVLMFYVLSLSISIQLIFGIFHIPV